MMEAGLQKEVESLIPFRNVNALQTVGYSELFSYLDGEISLDHAVDLIKKNTRQYAKRQMTWFKKDPAIEWIHPGDHRKNNQILILRSSGYFPYLQINSLTLPACNHSSLTARSIW